MKKITVYLMKMHLLIVAQFLSVSHSLCDKKKEEDERTLSPFFSKKKKKNSMETLSFFILFTVSHS